MARSKPVEGSRRSFRPSLYAQVRLARLWLPVAIAAVVVVYQLAVVPLGDEVWALWSQLLFYGIVGPVVTFVTLNWIASEIRWRERAQVELQRLYRELQDSYAVLDALQVVTERFASAPDLERVVEAATRGVRDVTGARAAAVVVGPGVVAVDAEQGADGALALELERDAQARDAALQASGSPEAEAGTGAASVLSLALRWGGNHQGSLHAHFTAPPDEKQRETLRILCADFSATAEAVQGRTRDLITLYEVDRSIRAEVNLERLLSALVTKMAARVEARTAGVYLREEDALELKSAVRLEPRDGGVDAVPLRAAAAPLPLAQGSIGREPLGPGPVLYPALEEADRARGGPILHGAGSAVALPLHAEGGVLGVVVLAHPDAGHFVEGSLPFLDMLASHVSLAVGNANAYRQSEELAIAEERARIAREIHDGVAQALAFAALKLDLVGRLMGRDPEQAGGELGEATTIVREMIREVRRSIFALRPIDLERHGFGGTLRRYVNDFGQQNDVLVDLEIEPLPELSIRSEAVLFRIFQEAMNNVAKHARARRVDVRVAPGGDGQVQVTVRDDGRGFDPSEVEDRVTSAGGLGLRQMRERVESRGGRFEVESAAGTGTLVRASVPA